MDRPVLLRKRCLTLISRIACRAAASSDPERIADTLMELSFVFRRGTRDRDLEWLHQELAEIESEHGIVYPLAVPEILKFEARSTCN